MTADGVGTLCTRQLPLLSKSVDKLLHVRVTRGMERAQHQVHGAHKRALAE